MRTIRQALVAAVLAVGAAAQAADYSTTYLTPPGARSSDAWDVNNVGQLVGSYESNDFTNSRGYLWANGVFTTISGPSGSLHTVAMGVSDAGIVVGAYIDTETVDETGATVLGSFRGYLYQGGTYVGIDMPGAVSTQARGISPDGRYVTGFGTFANGVGQGFVLDRSSGAWTSIGSATAGALTIVQGVNNLGQVVGDERVSLGLPGQVARTAFIYDLTTGIRVDQNLPGVTRTAYRDINDAGQLAGYVSANGLYGFTGSPASFQTFSYGSINNTLLEGINNAGWLAGVFSLDDGSSQAILLTPVPEPSVWLLSLAGFAMVGWQVRRRRA